jgi:hypothetical protein
MSLCKSSKALTSHSLPHQPLPQQILAPTVVALTLPMYIAVGLQQRWHGELLQALAMWQLAAAGVLHVLTVVLACWAMCSNRFFSSVVSARSELNALAPNMLWYYCS